jgi:hypothetical protein
MVRDMVERTVVDPTPEDILRIRREAEAAAIKSGAAPGSVEVYVEIDAQKKRVRATALGATELRTKDLAQKEISSKDREILASQSMHVNPAEVKTAAETEFFSVFTARTKMGRFKVLRSSTHPIRVVDRGGVIRLSLHNGIVAQSSGSKILSDLKSGVEKYTTYSEGGPILPGTHVLHGGHISDYSGLTTPDHITSVASMELKGVEPEEPVILIFSME